MKQIYKIWFVRRKAYSILIKVSNSNHYLVRFLLEQELERISSRLKRLHKAGKIPYIARLNPSKIKNKLVKKRVLDLLISRKSILNLLSVLKDNFKY